MRKILSIMLCALLLIGTFPFAAIAEELNENVDEAIATDVTDEAQAEDIDIVDVADVTLDAPAEENVQPPCGGILRAGSVFAVCAASYSESAMGSPRNSFWGEKAFSSRNT